MMTIRKNDRKLSDLIQEFVQDRRIKPHLYQKKIEEGWREMMGPWIFKETRAMRLQGRKLTIEIESAALKQELHFAREKILERINGLLNEDFLDEIRIV